MTESSTRPATARLAEVERYTVGCRMDTTRYRPVEQHLYSDLKGEAVILNMKNGKYYGLNGVGVSIWKALAQSASVSDIESAILSEYDVDSETCHTEVKRFLEQMLSESLIEEVDS